MIENEKLMGQLVQEMEEPQTCDPAVESLREAMARAGATSEQMQEAAARLNKAVTKLGQALGEACAAIIDAVAAAVNEVWPTMKELIEELAERVEEEESQDEDEDRHDGAGTTWVVCLLPPKTLEELYGQGVDHGPGPRPALIRAADDGPWRAETGENRKETAMLVTMNIVLTVIAAILFFGVVGEQDKEKNRNLTHAFVAVMAAIIVVNMCAWMR